MYWLERQRHSIKLNWKCTTISKLRYSDRVPFHLVAQQYEIHKYIHFKQIIGRFKTISHRQRLARFPKSVDLRRVKFLSGKHTLDRRSWIFRCVANSCWFVAKIQRSDFWTFATVHRFCRSCTCQVQWFNRFLYVIQLNFGVEAFLWMLIFLAFSSIAEYKQWFGRYCYRMWPNSRLEFGGRENFHKSNVPRSVLQYNGHHDTCVVFSRDWSWHSVCDSIKWMRLFVQQAAWNMVNI